MVHPIQHDDELIERFLTGESDDKETAFEALVNRHGPMVLGVCRRVLDNRHQDAEDAFQATFLVLARKSATIQHRQLLGYWLYEVAYRIAIRVKAQTARQQRWKAIPELAVSDVGPENAAQNELRSVLHAEIDRLPEKYRRLVVHCYLEGKTNAETARLLHCPVGTVKGRLSRARGLLRARLRRFGPALDHGARLSG